MGTLLFQYFVQATLLSATATSQPRWLEPGGAAISSSRGTLSLHIRDLGEEVPRRVAEDSLIFDLAATIERGNLELAVTLNTGVDAPWKAPDWTAPFVEQMQSTPAFPITVTANASYRF